MVILLIIFSFTVSMIVAHLVYKKKKSKRIGILLAFLSNSLILGSAAVIWYYSSIEMRIFGLGELAILYLVVAIPGVTWLNALMMYVSSASSTEK